MHFKIDPKEFNIDFMKSHGYIRKKCIKCGSYFWTNNPAQEICGETPCSKYSFLNSPPTRRRYTVSEMRSAFLKFFEKHGHEIINPYPVVARWRDDLLVTIASIADFQPYVTSGIAEPPANPLVISQPCLRFEDILNVGLTAGRHSTIFEMGGAHAFNRVNDRFIYWKDETINFHHEFATTELGIPEEYITYKEHFWVGGGNAGPDLEGIINGLEVSTLVFMMYKISDSKLEKTPILTVDTGYGIERWAWLSRGDPTAFHTIYGPILKWLMKEADLSIEDKVLYENTINSSLYDVSKPNIVKDIRRELAKAFGYNQSILNEKLSLFEELTVLLDHVKAIIFLIRDGAIPSNVREGYLTRMLLRKIFRIAALRKYDDIITELFKKEVEYWSKDFKAIKDVENVIYDILDLERKKYRNILLKLPNIIKRYKKKYGALSTDQLIEIYDSHGIPPEIVVDYLKNREGVKLNVPYDFYDKVSKRHIEKVSATSYIPKTMEGYHTEKLYYVNPYWRSMLAKVLYANNNMLILDRTVFYPEGGGQLGDQGIIMIGDDLYNIVDTKIEGDAIIHVLDKPVNKNVINHFVIGHINWNRRMALMRHHTATHILLGAIRRVLGNHVWQAGAEKRPEIARLDVTHYKLPESSKIIEIEKLANEIISKKLKVETIWINRGLAEKTFGVKIYQGGMIPGKKLRIVKIDDWDVEACGGTHVQNTSELKYIRIISVEKIHDGIIRFNYIAGDQAIIESKTDQMAIEKLTRLLNVDRDHIIDSVVSKFDEKKLLEKKYEELEYAFIKLYSSQLYHGASSIGNYKFVFLDEENVERLVKIIEYIEERYTNIFLVGVVRSKRGVNVIVFTGKDLRKRGFNAYSIGEEVLKSILKGGGKGDERYARFGGKFEGDINKLKEVFSEYVQSKFSL